MTQRELYEFFSRAVSIVNLLAVEGIHFGPDVEDPQDYMTDLAANLQVSEEHDCWDKAEMMVKWFAENRV